MVQDKQDEINQLRAEKSTASGQSAEQARKEIEMRNEISRLKGFEEKSQKFEEQARALEEQLRMLGSENPDMADRRRLAEIIQNQQDKINQMMNQMGGKDLVTEVKKKEARLKVLEPENQRLRDTMKEIQKVNNTNKVRYFINLVFTNNITMAGAAGVNPKIPIQSTAGAIPMRNEKGMNSYICTS